MWFLLCGFLQKGIALLTTPIFTRVMSDAEYGRYSVYNSWYSIFQIIVSLNLAAGVYTRGLVKNEEDKDRFSSSLMGLSTLCILIWAITSALEILTILAPENYGAALWVIPPVTASVYFMFLYNLFATFEHYYEQTHFVMIASVSGAILNLILNYIFIHLYGFIAAGYTTLVCYILYSLAHYFFMNKVIKKFMNAQKVYDVKIILLIGFLLIGASAVMMILYNHPLIRYTLLVITLILILLFRRKFIDIFKIIKKEK